MSQSAYYKRNQSTHLDGTPIFKTDEDEQNENTVSKIVTAAWDCRLHSFGKLSPIDWYAEREGRVVGLLELKSRSHASDVYETVFLNVRKWLALQLGAVGLGVPAIFVVRFTDETKWIRVADVDATKHRIGGLSRIVKSRNDVEPVIEVPVASMKKLYKHVVTQAS